MSIINKIFNVTASVLIVLVAIVIALIIDDTTTTSSDDPYTLTQDSQLPPRILEWKRKGSFITVNGLEMFVTIHNTNSMNSNNNAKIEDIKHSPVILFHGFPSSSFEFHKVIPHLEKNIPKGTPILTFDLVGFGFSEKPGPCNSPKKSTKSSSSSSSQNQNQQHSYCFSYGIVDHADQVMMLLEKINIRSAHFISHDMGDTVLNEIISRVHRRLAPERYLKNGFFKSIVFTNGGMVYRESQPRIGQVLLAMPSPIGSAFNRLLTRLDGRGRFLSAQLKTVWSPEAKASLAGTKEMEQDIADIQTLLHWEGGHLLVSETISYIPDRKKYDEFRWHSALKDLDSLVAKSDDDDEETHHSQKCGFVWGDSDQVAPMSVVETAYYKIMGGGKTNKCKLIVMKGKGHFLQLEDPENWTKNVVSFFGM